MSISAIEIPHALTWKRDVLPFKPRQPPLSFSDWTCFKSRQNSRLPSSPIIPSHPVLPVSQSDTLTQEREKYQPVRITHAVLAVCLNLSTPQTQRVKTEETFFDPSTRHHERATRKIMSNLVHQLDAVQRLAILALPDPRQETVMDALVRARRESRENYILCLYNNHGTLAPTEQGELWLYDQDFPTQPSTYNPVFISHLVDTAKQGTIFIFDSDNSGRLIDAAVEHGKARDEEIRNRFAATGQNGSGTGAGGNGLSTSSTETSTSGGTSTNATAPSGPTTSTSTSTSSHPTHPFRSFTDTNIYFGASSHTQVLPIAEGLPRDVFTSCMLAPLMMALRFYYLNDSFRLSVNLREASPNVKKEGLLGIPGGVDDRDTPLGELNWLLSAVIETIAWQSMSPQLFRRLFRSDPALNGFAKGFILAQRVMRTYDCIPMSYPPLPSAHLNPLWQVWDLALDDFLTQLPIQKAAYGGSYVYRSPIMMPELLQAFGVQVKLSASAITEDTSEEERAEIAARTKIDLPFAIHSLLGTRLRPAALTHMTRYLDIGGKDPVFWAFHCGLDLLQPRLLDWQSTQDIPKVVYLYSRMLSHPMGPRVLTEVKRGGGRFVINVLVDLLRAHPEADESSMSQQPAEVIASILYMMWKTIDSDLIGHNVIESEGWAEVVVNYMEHPDSLVRQWVPLVWARACLADITTCPAARMENILEMLGDPCIEVRASAAYTLYLLVDKTRDLDPSSIAAEILGHTQMVEATPTHPEFMAAAARQIRGEANRAVRDIMVRVIECLFSRYQGWFEIAAWQYLAEEGSQLSSRGMKRERWQLRHSFKNWIVREDHDTTEKSSCVTAFKEMFVALLGLSLDPDPSICQHACALREAIARRAMQSSLGDILPEMQAAIEVDQSFIRDLPSQHADPNETPRLDRQISELFVSDGESTESSTLNNRILSTLDGISSSPRLGGIPTTSSFSQTEDRQAFHSFWPEQMAEYFATPRLLWPDVPRDDQDAKMAEKAHRLDVMAIECEVEVVRPWMSKVAEISVARTPIFLANHGVDRTLAIGLGKEIELWDVVNRTKRSCIKVADGCSYRQAFFLNESDEPDTLLTVSDHGVVRVYKHALTPEIETRAIFRVVDDRSRSPSTRLFGAWNQGRGEIHLTGATGDISIWSADREQCVRRMLLGRESRASAVDTEKERGNVSLLGFHDGGLGVFDQRQKDKVCVRTYEGHRGRVLKVGLNIGHSKQEMVSVGTDGKQLIWDLRVAVHPITGNATQGRHVPPAAATSIHSSSGACGILSPTSNPSTLDLCINRLAFPTPIRTTDIVVPWSPAEGEGREARRVVCMSFHPHRMQLAYSAGPKVIIQGQDSIEVSAA